ncbi:MAG: hypothetical protein ACQEXB_26170 [Bacillota bacterium]
MFHHVGSRFIWMLLGSTVLATVVSIAMYRAGLITLPKQSTAEKDQESKNAVKRKRVGKIRLS